METWKDVVGFEGLYLVSDEGNVCTVKTGKLKTLSINIKDKRLHVQLWKSNKQKCCKVHRLVLTAFVGPCPQGMECCHNDGNPFNNKVSNLRWNTPTNNQADRTKHGTSNRGEQCGTAKLTQEQVDLIRKDTRLQRVIASEYGVLQNTISRIKSGKRWAHS